MTRVSIRPTARAALVFAFSAPAALVIVLFFPAFWYAALYFPAAVLAVMLADLGVIPGTRRIDGSVDVPSRLYLGRTDCVTFRLACNGPHPRLFLESLLEISGDAQTPESFTGPLDSGNPVLIHLPLAPQRRGRLTVKALWFRLRGPLGLMEVRRIQRLDAAVDVVPDIKGIHEDALRFFSQNAVHGEKTQRMRGEGTEFDTLREYAPGMDSRFIDWKHSARHRKLLCKEFRQECNHQIIFGFDTGRLMLEPVDGMPKLDHAVRAALLLGWISLHSGDFVGGCSFDARFNTWNNPVRGMPQFSRFQRFTAGLDYSTAETNFTLGLTELNARLQRRALVVLFTDFVDTISADLLLESLHRMARRHLVVFVALRDPLPEELQRARPETFLDAARAVVADDFMRDRSIVLERAARLGVHCLDVPARRMSSALLNRYLLIKQRGLL